MSTVRRRVDRPTLSLFGGDHDRDPVPRPDAPPGPLLIDVKALSALLSRSVASLERDQAAGRLPAPVRVGGSRRWRRAEVEAWVAVGCPDQARWAALRAVAAGGGR